MVVTYLRNFIGVQTSVSSMEKIQRKGKIDDNIPQNKRGMAELRDCFQSPTQWEGLVEIEGKILLQGLDQPRYTAHKCGPTKKRTPKDDGNRSEDGMLDM